MASLEELVSKDLNENNIFTDLRDQAERLRRLEEYGGAYHQVTRVSVDLSELQLVNIIAGNGLVGGGVISSDVTITLGTPSTLSVSSNDAVTATSHTHAITTSSNPGAAASILATDASGYLQLKRLGLDVSPTAPLHIRSGTIPQLLLEYNASEIAYLQTSGSGDLRLYSSGNLELYPDGDILIGAGNKSVLPVNTYDVNIGSIAKKYLTVHAAELWVSTLVAQDVLATIGGRVVVAPTTKLTADLGDGVGDTTISVEHNNLSGGDIIYLESAISGTPQVEFMLVTSGYSGSGPYTYTVERDLDGTGRNLWYAGDSILNTGKGGDGFIDLYSVSGIADASAFGPTIVGSVRGYSANNVSNPGFEIAGLGGADIWSVWNEGAGSGALTDETTLVHSGGHACKASYVTGQASLYTTMATTPGNEYIFSFWTRGDGSVTGQYGIYDLSNFSYIVGKTSTGISGTTYTQKVIRFTAPAGCFSVKLELWSPASAGDAYFDDVEAFLLNYNGWTEHWAIGNLNGLYEVSSDVYGVGLGRTDKAYVLIDDTDGVTIRDSIGTKLIQLDISGNVVLGNVVTNEANVFWNSANNRLEFRGGASGTSVQSFIDTDGSFVAGSPTDKDVKLNSDGLTLIAQPQGYVTGGKSIDFYSTTDSVDVAMITVSRWSAGGDNYAYLILQATDDLTNGVNYSGHSNPRVRIGFSQFGHNQGAIEITNAALIVGNRSFSDIFPAVAGRIYSEGNIDVGGVVSASDDVRTGGGLSVGSSSTDVATGYIRLTGSIYNSVAYACRVYRTTDLSMATSTWYYVGFNAETYDPRGMHDNATNNSRITIQESGFYIINAAVQIQNHTVGYVDLIIQQNRSDNLARKTYPAWAGNQYETLTAMKWIPAGNYVELAVWHNQGSNINLYTATRFAAVRIA